MGKKKEAAPAVEETKETSIGAIAKKVGANGLGVGESIVAILKASKSKKGLTVVDVVAKMVDAYGDGKESTVRAKLGSKEPIRLSQEEGVIIEVIEGATPNDRAYRYVGPATDEQKAEWKAAKKAAKAEKKAAKSKKTDPPAPADPEPTGSKYQDNDSDNPADDDEAAAKAAKKAAKKAKKAAKKAGK